MEGTAYVGLPYLSFESATQRLTFIDKTRSEETTNLTLTRIRFMKA